MSEMHSVGYDKHGNKFKFISGEEWSRIRRQLCYDCEKQDKIAEERAFNEYLKKESKEMAKHWPDSFENLAKEKRKKYLGHDGSMTKDEKIEKIRDFLELTEEKEKQRDIFLKKMEQVMAVPKAPPRDLHSALVLSTTLFEREAQMNFKKKIKKDCDKKEKKYGKFVIEDAKIYYQEEREKYLNKLKVFNDYRKMLADQIKIMEEEKANKLTRKVNLEVEDDSKAAEEMKVIEDHFKEIEKSKRQALIDNNKYSKKLFERNKKIKEYASYIEDQNVERFNEGKRRLEYMRKAKAKERMFMNIKNREALALKIYEKYKPNPEIEEKSYNKAIAEQAAKYKANLEVRVDHIKKAADFKNKIYQEYIELENKRKQEEHYQKKLDVKNRIRNEEIYKDFLKYETEMKINEFKQNRRTWNEQLNELEERRNKNKNMLLDERYYDEIRLKAEDEEYLKYSEGVVEKCKKIGKPLFPIMKVIHEYKDKNRLLTPKPIPIHLKSNVPIPFQKDNKTVNGKFHFTR